MIVSPHTHAESPLTGSTVKALVDRAKELGREYFAYTDHGHLSSSLKAMGFCKPDKAKSATEAQKRNIQFIPGIELYFKDSKCPVVTGSEADRCKYFTVSLYCHDQTAYQELSKHVSKDHFPITEIREEKQQLWSWADLAHMAQFNTSIVLGGPHCIVGKVLLAGRADLGEKVLLKLRELFPGGRTWASLVVEPLSKKWQNVVEIKYADGTSQSMLSSDLVTTNKARMMKAKDLAERSGHFVIINTYSDRMLTEVNKKIESVKIHKGFLPLPGGDAILMVNKFLKALSRKHGINLMVSDYAYYANKEDKVVQTMRLEGNDKLHSNFYMKTTQDVGDYLVGVMGFNPADVDNLLAMNAEWAQQFKGLTLKYGWRLVDSSPDQIKKAMEIIRKNGRMKWDDPVWVERLKEEINVIVKNPNKDLTGYFLPICDIMTHYADNGQLTGPGRGSAGGSLFCYLLGITQVNPMKYELSFPRFLSNDRLANGDYPDVDSDFPDRELLVGKDTKSGYLYGLYGDRAAQISTRHTLRLKSTIKDTNRYFKGKVEPVIESLTDGLPDPPQGVTDSQFVFGYENDGAHVPGLIEVSEELKKYSEERPEEWAIVSRAMGITRAFSKHASAFVLSDVPIRDVIPTKEGNITQYEAKACEAAGLIKYDFLVVKNLKDIEVCLKLINKKNNENQRIGWFTHKGKLEYIWDLPEDLEAHQSVWGGSTETIFQINTKAMIPFVKEIKPESVEDISTILALVRPGPLDYIDPKTGRSMAEEYYWRRQGRSQPDLPELAALIPETYGIIVFQEQSLKISKELGGMTPADAEKLRRLFSKKLKVEALNMKPVFMSTAIPKIGEEKANKIWDMMETSSRYSFNKSHSVAYAMISYAGVFLKHHYPLEWWAAVLTNADEKEITGEFWPYVKDLMMPPDINLSTDTMVVDYSLGKIRSKLGIIRGVGDATIEPIVSGRPYKDIADYVNKEVAGPSLTHKLIHVNVLDSLFPPTANLAEKLLAYENAVQNKIYRDKCAKAEKEGRKFRGLAPSGATLPEKYMNLHPLQDAAMRKAVLPSMPIDTTSLGARFSKVLVPHAYRPIVMSANGHETPLISGAALERLDNIAPDKVTKDIYVAATCYVIEAKKFDYAKNTKSALKMILDCDGYISEKVLWPSYDSGQLEYPPELKKGAIATFFFKKRVAKKDMSIMSVVVEG